MSRVDARANTTQSSSGCTSPGAARQRHLSEEENNPPGNMSASGAEHLLKRPSSSVSVDPGDVDASVKKPKVVGRQQQQPTAALPAPVKKSSAPQKTSSFASSTTTASSTKKNVKDGMKQTTLFGFMAQSSAQQLKQHQDDSQQIHADETKFAATENKLETTTISPPASTDVNMDDVKPTLLLTKDTSDNTESHASNQNSKPAAFSSIGKSFVDLGKAPSSSVPGQKIIKFPIEDLHPSALSHSRPLHDLRSVPTVMDTVENNRSRLTLTMDQSMELLSVVDFLTTFGDLFEGYETATLSLVNVESFIDRAPRAPSDILTLYHVLLTTLTPISTPSTIAPAGPRQLQQTQSMLLFHMKENHKSAPITDLYETHLPALPASRHVELLSTLVGDIIATDDFHDYLEDIMESLESRRKERSKVKQRLLELKAQVKATEKALVEAKAKVWTSSSGGVGKAQIVGSITGANSFEVSDDESVAEKIEAERKKEEARLRKDVEAKTKELDALNSELVEVSSEESRLSAAVESEAQKLKATNGLRLLGLDRFGRRYFWVDVGRGVLDEEEIDIFGIVVEPLMDTNVVQEGIHPPGAIAEDAVMAAVPPGWRYVDSYVTLQKLNRSFNDKGFREKELADAIREKVKSCKTNLLTPATAPTVDTAADCGTASATRIPKFDPVSVKRCDKLFQDGIEAFAVWAESRGAPQADLSPEEEEEGRKRFEMYLVKCARRELGTLFNVLIDAYRRTATNQEDSDDDDFVPLDENNIEKVVALVRDRESKVNESTDIAEIGRHMVEAFNCVDRRNDGTEVARRLDLYRPHGWSGICDVIDVALNEVRFAHQRNVERDRKKAIKNGTLSTVDGESADGTEPWSVVVRGDRTLRARVRRLPQKEVKPAPPPPLPREPSPQINHREMRLLKRAALAQAHDEEEEDELAGDGSEADVKKNERGGRVKDTSKSKNSKSVKGGKTTVKKTLTLAKKKEQPISRGRQKPVPKAAASESEDDDSEENDDDDETSPPPTAFSKGKKAAPASRSKDKNPKKSAAVKRIVDSSEDELASDSGEESDELPAVSKGRGGRRGASSVKESMSKKVATKRTGRGKAVVSDDGESDTGSEEEDSDGEENVDELEEEKPSNKPSSIRSSKRRPDSVPQNSGGVRRSTRRR